LRRCFVLSVFVLLILVIAVGACGKKAPPFLPKAIFLSKVVDLKGQWVEGNLKLTGTIDTPKPKNDIHSEIKGCKVYYAEFPVESPPCNGCPIQYAGLHEFGPEVITSEGFACSIPIKGKDRILFFKVHLIGLDGVPGPASDPVRVDME
jgi:predicted small lipoprotein YifL